MLLLALLFALPARATAETTGMATLLGWSALNLGVGGVGAVVADEPRWRQFHLANAGWNTVNAGLAVGGLLGAPKARALSPEDREARQHRLQKVLLFNAGLDVAYMTAGGWLWDRGVRLDDPRQHGWGQALVLQGGFLLAFDLGLAAAIGHELRVAPVAGEAAGVAIAGRW